MLRTPFRVALVALLFTRSVAAQSPHARFWAWFAAHDSALLAVRTGNEPICHDLAQRLQQINPDLTFEFGPPEHGRREFVLSAGGIRDAFPAVIELANAAPSLTHWRVVKFRPPRPDVTKVTVAGVSLDAANVLFLATPAEDRTDLTLAVPGYRETTNHTFEQAGYLLLDGMLGEYGVETAIGGITFIDAASRPPGDWQPLPRLSQAVPIPAAP